MNLQKALTLRKHLSAKVEQLKPIKQIGDQGMFELKTKRVHVGENTDEVTFQIPKISLSEVTEEYDFYAKQLRSLDDVIQEANYRTEVTFKEEEFDPKAKAEAAK